MVYISDSKCYIFKYLQTSVFEMFLKIFFLRFFVKFEFIP